MGKGRGLSREGEAAGVRPYRSAVEDRALVLPGQRSRISAVMLPAQAAFRLPSDGVRLRAVEPHPDALEAVGFLTFVANCKVSTPLQRKDADPILQHKMQAELPRASQSFQTKKGK
ncbi:hypothetical protein NDU88_007204 [Pleurodeles waltl]|uniref:Uncharacterized protein n=1 Tax=Pleurodeles waltl TaxID=8319 RepID=A0AAV7RPE5_PLEWA|nr:hypothetical protein NDU88_007204 [Pleurodeles waltl]